MVFILSNNRNSYRNKRGLISVALQIPLLITLAVFVSIFVSYSRLELGNLSYAASYNIKIDSINVTKDIPLDNSRKKEYVYEVAVGNKDTAMIYADELLSKLNTSVNEKLNDVYDDTLVCTSTDGNYSIWVDYLGFKTRFNDFSQMNSVGKTGVTLSEIRDLFKLYNVNIPDEVEFSETGNGDYYILVDMAKVGDDILTGELSFTINRDNKVTRYINNILTIKPYKEYEIISEEEAYNKILNGEFKDFGTLNKKSKIQIINVSLKYEIDSKGFYQPVYYFGVETDSYLGNIVIPAIIIDK